MNVKHLAHWTLVNEDDRRKLWRADGGLVLVRLWQTHHQELTDAGMVHEAGTDVFWWRELVAPPSVPTERREAVDVSPARPTRTEKILDVERAGTRLEIPAMPAPGATAIIECSGKELLLLGARQKRGEIFMSWLETKAGGHNGRYRVCVMNLDESGQPGEQLTL